MNPIRTALPALLALLALCGNPGLAQTANAPEATRSGPSNNLVSIDFPGGPFSKLAAALKGERLSIVQSGGLDPTLPAFSVTDAPVESVMLALARIVEPQGYVLNPTGRNVAVLVRRPDNPEMGFVSLQLEQKLGERKAEDVVAAIQQGCEFYNEGRPSTLRFKYHPATKLLFVAGTPAEISVADRIFSSLPNVVRLPPKDTPPPSEKK